MIKTRLIKLLSHARKYIAFQVIWKWLSLLCQVVMIYTASMLLEGVLFGTLGQKQLLQDGIVVLVAVFLRSFCDRQASYASYEASVDVKRILRQKIYEKLLKLGASYRENVATSEVVQMAAEGVEQLETYFGRYLSQLFYSLLAPITLFIILSFVNVKASAVLLLCVPLIPISIVAVQKIAKKLLNKYWGIYTELGDSFLENLQGLTTLKIYQADGKKAVEMDEESQRFRQITMKVLTMQLNSTSVMDIIAYGGAAVGMIVTVSEFLKGNVSFGGAFMVILLASEFFIPLRLLGSFFHIAMNGMAASDKIFALLDLPEPEERKLVLEKQETAIHMENVWFSYGNRMDFASGNESQKNQKADCKADYKADGDYAILKGVSMDFRAGSLISLVGTSGCGKSTIAGILMGRNKGYEGSITIQGKELWEISEESLMKHITMVSHNSYLFKGTVRDNLVMGKENASEKEMYDVLKKVNLLGFLQGQQGLDTPVMEKGSNFSGGQCQRLALARALLHDTPVYIFDEATSNIDMESEEMIMDVIRELAKTRTILLISHRLANVVDSDRIYMLENGCVNQCGTHQELMKANGAYTRLYRYQSELEAYGKKNGPGHDRKKIEKGHRTDRGKITEQTEQKTDAGKVIELKKRRKGIVIMGQLIGLVKPLFPIMCLAVLLGVLGYLCAIFLTILAGYGLMQGLGVNEAFWLGTPEKMAAILIFLAVLRGILHYGEQYCNHFIAFKLLAIIRHKVFAALRKLCPAKLEGRDKGNLISIITSDIELLEVFYAHTISPIVIAVITSLIMAGFIGAQYLPAGVIALAGYVVVGVVIPLWNGKRGAAEGMEFRNFFGELNSFILDSLRGLDETIQYGKGNERMDQMNARSENLGKMQKKLNHYEAVQGSLTNMAILLFSFGMLFFMLWNFRAGNVNYDNMLIAVISMMGSFGPVVALSNLSNNLNQTLASGERVLSLLEEEPQIEEVSGQENVVFDGAAAEQVNFAYECAAKEGAEESDGKPIKELNKESVKEQILKDYSMELPKGKIVGIHGASGSGKSTFLKLLMRFWDANSGRVMISGKDIKEINTANLREMESYVTQETYLFHDSIANNIAVGKPGASREEIMEAAKKASIHDFIMALPKDYDTEVGELGDTLSGGEKQRIGIARAFLHDAPFLLLDEPTSNLDSLNEGIILKSLKESCQEKTVVLVSHRKSTMNLADVVYEMDQGRVS